ncbi:MAG: HAMP domain-containing sensor histidine kinase [Syntrophomonas sp.]|nr:HAMP domain-containing sensor histidine kinase [Syntrophomonas sp.]
MGKFKSISSKILISYLAVVFFTFLVTALAFYPLLVGVLERRAEIGLEKQAWEIAYSIGIRESSFWPPQEHDLPVTIILLGRSVESDFIWLDPQDSISFSSQPEKFPPGQSLSQLGVKLREEGSFNRNMSNIFKNEDYMAAEVPVGTADGAGETVMTFISFSMLQTLYRETLLVVLGSLLVAMLAALLIAFFLIRYLVKPLRKLEEYAQAVGNRQFDMRLDTKGDDEMSQLATAFNQMADQLKSYDEGMRRFFQNASHEMKTPLMSINGYAEGIRDGIFTGPALDNAIDIIHKESLRLRNVVENLIDITILEQPHKKYLLPNDLSYILEEVIETVGGYAMERKVEICSKVHAGTWVVGDWEQLHSLFVNLMSNGIRHAWSSVTVESQLIDNQTKVLITVHDDGSGFRAEDLKHAFEHFYTGGNGGSGLGLSIVQKIITEHAGRLRIYNSSQGGAVVEIVLPMAAEEDGKSDGLLS